MDNIIRISAPSLIPKSGGRLRLFYNIFDADEEKNIWFDIPSEYENGLSIDKSDGILLHILLYAIRAEKDIEICGSVSERLLYQLERHFIPAYAAQGGFRRIHIYVTNKSINQKLYTSSSKTRVAATGMSCGIDSLYTYFTHSKESIDLSENRKIGLLTHFDVGAFHYGDGNRQYVGNETLEERHLRKAKRFADDVHIPLLIVHSNVAEIIPMDHGISHTMRNCGTVLLFQNLISIYYYSSAFGIWNFCFDIKKDMAYYDSFTLAMISTENTTFYSVDANASRLEKTRLITEYPLSKMHLNVCTVSDENCGKCQKCSRTLVHLDALGKLQDYKKVFPLEKYNRNISWGYVLANKKDSCNIGISDLGGKINFSPLINFWKIIFLLLKPIEKYLKGLSPTARRQLVSFANKLNIRVPW